MITAASSAVAAAPAACGRRQQPNKYAIAAPSARLVGGRRQATARRAPLVSPLARAGSLRVFAAASSTVDTRPASSQAGGVYDCVVVRTTPPIHCGPLSLFGHPAALRGLSGPTASHSLAPAPVSSFALLTALQVFSSHRDIFPPLSSLPAKPVRVSRPPLRN